MQGLISQKIGLLTLERKHKQKHNHKRNLFFFFLNLLIVLASFRVAWVNGVCKYV